MELQRPVDDDVPGINSDNDVDTAAKDGNDNGWSNRILYTQEQSVWNVTRIDNQQLRQGTHAEHEPRRILMPLPPGVALKPEPPTQRRFSRLAKRQTCADDDDVVMLAPACIAPTRRVTLGQGRSTMRGAENDDYLMPAPSD